MKARLNGVDLFLEIRGDSGPPVMLVHGSSDDHHTWDGVVPLLARRSRVTTYDRRGHGESDRPASQAGLADEAGDLAALIENLGIAPVHVVGNASGADVVLHLIVKRPDLFASASLHEPAANTLDLDKLSSFGAPLLLTHGDKSPTSASDVLDDISDVLPRAQRYIFRGAGNAPHLTHPDDFALVLGSFISGVAGA